ncbi:MAG: hypothetical protein FWD14_01860 [Treponema sp.]|nr:hypothetical protein [Treponema sp.]
MPRGGKSKPIEEHISSGTNRQDKQGINPSITDYDRLEEMKKTLFDAFNKSKVKLENVDIDKNPESYKAINSVMSDQIKTFFAISKYQVIKNDAKKEENGKLNITDFK